MFHQTSFVRLHSKTAAACFRTGSGAGEAMATDSRPFFRDDEIITDRDGIPHYTGKFPHLMREYRRRVIFAFSNLEGEGDTLKRRQRICRRRSRGLQSVSLTHFMEKPSKPVRI